MPKQPHSLWYKDAIFYEVSPRAFKDGNGDGIGDFAGLTQSLDYIADLGVNCIWLLPMYPSPLRDDGYDIADYYGIHPDLGTMDDFKLFLAEAKKRNLRVIADLVVNHCSDQHPWFQDARRGPESPFYDYFVWTDDPKKYGEARIIFTDTEKSNWTWDESAKKFYWHRFYSSQPDLNYDNPKLVEEMKNVFTFWMDLGLDGFRVDAVPYLFEREGTNCENLPETHQYLRDLRAYMDEKYPEAIMLGEANQWPEDVLPYFGTEQEPEFHLSFHFPIMPRLYQAIRQEDRGSLEWIIKRTPDIPPTAQWAIFLRNHDELTLEMVTEEEREYMWREYAPDPRMRLNVGIRRRMFPLLDNDRRQAELLHGLLLSLPGSPVLYYGDEIGMGDNIYLPDRYGVRTPMQWDDGRNAGFSTAKPSQLHWPVIADPGPYHYQSVNVQAAKENRHSFYWWLVNLIDQRERFQAFGRGEIRFLFPNNKKIFAYFRVYGEEVVLVVANLSSSPQPCELDLAHLEGYTPMELMANTPFPQVRSHPYQLSLGPYGFYWFYMVKD